MAGPVDPVAAYALTKYTPRVDFQPDEFRGQVQLWGHKIRWERASRCPCGLVYEDPDSNHTVRVRAGNVDCPDGCRGTGWIYSIYEPAGDQPIKALVNDTSADKKFLQAFGELAFGGVRLTMLPEFLPAWRDRITDLDGSWRFHDQPRQRKATIEGLTYPVKTTQMRTGDPSNPTLPVLTDLGILDLRVADQDGNLLPSVQPRLGIDFEITPEGWVKWLGVKATGTVSISGVVGTVVPLGTVFTWVVDGYPTRRYETTEAATLADEGGEGIAREVPIACMDTGTIGNVPRHLKLAATLTGVSEVEVDDAITNGEDTPNPCKLGQWYSSSYITYPVYIIRSEPHLYRHTYVAQKPFVNAVDGYRGSWAPEIEAFPAGEVEAPGDYFEVYEAGEIDGVTFDEGDVLVALVQSPPGDSFVGWGKISSSAAALPTVLVPMTTMSLAWLETMGDPFGREQRL